MDCVSVQEKCSQLVLDTPNRNEILKEGPPEQSQVNILGRGSYGVVLKAVYGGRQVAVKIIKNADGKENAINNEANILGWSHPNVVQLLKIESTSNYSIIIMERFPGQCLQLILDSIELPLAHRIHVALDVTDALIYCHSQQVLHLDVKPQNVLVAFTRRGRRRQTHGERDYICKLCDFGSSRNLQENARTRVHGTVRYMSPEALKGGALSSAADVYSLGVTMWQLEARQLPYAWIECNQIVAYQVGKNHLRPNKMPSDFSSSKDRLAISGKHENCLCEHFSSEFSYRSLDQIRSILQKTKTLSPFQPKTAANHRRPEKLKNQISRNLIGTFKETFVGLKENLLVDEVRCDIMEDECEGDYSLKSVFEQGNTLALPHGERVFEKLFLSCWQSDAMARPSILDVRQTLLSCFSSEKREYKAS